MRARHYLPETLESDTTESGWADEGWYEESEAYEYLMPLEHDPTHWMPLPAGPDTAPQPAKREPLTPRELELIDGMIEVQLNHAERCDAIANRRIAAKQKEWDMERVELLRKIRAHGITGEAK